MFNKSKEFHVTWCRKGIYPHKYGILPLQSQYSFSCSLHYLQYLHLCIWILSICHHLPQQHTIGPTSSKCICKYNSLLRNSSAHTYVLQVLCVCEWGGAVPWPYNTHSTQPSQHVTQSYTIANIQLNVQTVTYYCRQAQYYSIAACQQPDQEVQQETSL